MKNLLFLIFGVGVSLSLLAQTKVPKKDIEPGTPPPTMSDVAYGRLERQVLDFWRADANKPAPLMIYFHGGGFRKGSKRQISRDIRVNEYLKNGISCISAEYPFSDEMDIPSICRECEGVVTFVRSKAKEWNIDTNRIGVSGCSAGAIIALWIGTHRHAEISVIGTTQQPLGTAVLVPYITRNTPPCIIYQKDAERNQLHAPVNAQMVKDAYAQNGVECLVYGAGANRFKTPPAGKDKFTIMLEFYMRIWGLNGTGTKASQTEGKE
jgi:acetyl esterase/lipase